MMALCMAAVLPVLAADDKAKEIAPLLSQRTFAVIRVEVAAVNIDAAFKQMQDVMLKVSEDGKLSDREVKDMAMAREKVGAFLKAGGKRLYLVISDMTMRTPPLGAIVMGEKADKEALAKLFNAKLVVDGDPTTMPTATGPSMGGYAKEINGLLVFGAPAAVERAAKAVPGEREDIQKALASAGDSAVAIALVPPKFLVVAALQNMPTLPPMLGGGDTAPLGNIDWIGIGIAAPPKLAAMVTVQMEDAESAKSLDALVQQTLGSLAKTTSQPTSSPWISGAIELPLALGAVQAMKFQAKGDQLVGGVDSKQMTDVLEKQVIPLLREAKKMAKRAGSISNLRNLSMAVLQYTFEHDNKLPPALESLKPHGVSDQMLTNPRMPDRKPGYVYVQLHKSIDQYKNADRIVIIYENYKEWGDGIAVGFLDGHVSFVTDEQAFKKMLEDTKKINEAK